MPAPIPPSTPNYNSASGQITTNRYDFQSHIDGASFRHQSNQIDLSISLTINNTLVSDVQDAIYQLSLITAPPVINHATTNQLGIIQLSGDIAGTATNVKVTALQGRPVSTTIPALNNVLTWNGNVWTPIASVSAFTAGGDLAGSNVIQQVVNLTGNNTGQVTSEANSIVFNANVTAPILTQSSTNINTGQDMQFIAQSTTAAGLNGGNIILSGGNKGSGATSRGGVRLQINGSDLVSIFEPIANQRVLSLVNGSQLSYTQMPANTGDLVMYIANTTTPPTTGNPVGGCILYSQSGQLYVKQPNALNFAIGSIPNPSIWGPTGAQTYSYRATATSTTNAGIQIFTYSLPNYTATKVDVIMVGKEVGSADSAQFNLSIGYVRHGGLPVSVGSLTIADPRTTTAAAGWSVLPTISVDSANNLNIFTGGNAATNINWIMIVQLTMCVSS